MRIDSQSKITDAAAMNWIHWSLLSAFFAGLTAILAKVGVTGVSWLCYFKALQLGDASRVAPVDKLSVVFVILLAALFLKEKMTIQHLVGGLLIVSGAVVMAWKSGKA